MQEKVKIELEFNCPTSPNLLYNRLSTASGLSEWFADDVYVNSKNYTFIWERSEQQAQLLKRKKNDFARFQWIEDEGSDYYFEFRIQKHELTNELSLFITDFVEPEDKDSAIELWEKQVEQLKHNMGI